MQFLWLLPPRCLTYCFKYASTGFNSAWNMNGFMPVMEIVTCLGITAANEIPTLSTELLHQGKSQCMVTRASRTPSDRSLQQPLREKQQTASNSNLFTQISSSTQGLSRTSTSWRRRHLEFRSRQVQYPTGTPISGLIFSSYCLEQKKLFQSTPMSLYFALWFHNHIKLTDDRSRRMFDQAETHWTLL